MPHSSKSPTAMNRFLPSHESPTRGTFGIVNVRMVKRIGSQDTNQFRMRSLFQAIRMTFADASPLREPSKRSMRFLPRVFAL